MKVYFHTDKKLRLEPPQEVFGSLAYKYDPKNPVPTIGGANLTITKGPKDQRPVEGRLDVLLFTSPVLDRYVEITGPVKVKLWASSTAPDTDFTAKLCDVYPDGRSMIVLDGILRASHRSSMDKTEPMEAGKIYEFDIDLWSTSLVVGPGHRVCVAISSSNAPRFEPNPNTGQPSGSRRQDPGRHEHDLHERRPSLPHSAAGGRTGGRQGRYKIDAKRNRDIHPGHRALPAVAVPADGQAGPGDDAGARGGVRAG